MKRSGQKAVASIREVLTRASEQIESPIDSYPECKRRYTMIMFSRAKLRQLATIVRLAAREPR